LSDRVIIIKGNYRNFVKSLCDAIKTGRFLWGFKEKSKGELTRIKKNRDALVVFYVNDYGFAMIARVDEVPYSGAESLYWPDEVEKDSVMYRYRFTMIPIKVPRCFLEDEDLCRLPERTADKSCFVNHGDVVNYINRECGIKKSLLMPSSVYVMEHLCEARKLIEYLDKQEEVLIKIGSRSETMVGNPIASIVKLLSTVMGNDAVQALLRVVGRVTRSKDSNAKEAVNAVLTNVPEHVRIGVADTLAMLRQSIEPAIKALAPCSEKIVNVLQDSDLVLGALAVLLTADSLGGEAVKEVIDVANSVVRENLYAVMLCRLYNL